MPTPSPKKLPKLFLSLSLVILLLDLTFIGITFFQSRNALIINFETDAKNQQATFKALFKETTNNMLQIATFVAHDPRIQQAFLQGKHAVESEGGGAGQQQASIARANLLNIVASSWGEITKRFKARQLHFHLGPGSTSFLRVHKPQKFGDNMDNVRYTIVDANQYQKATSGFETGRVYSGIRGVLPVFAIDSKKEKKIHVGAVESGISYHNIIHNLAETLNINIAVLLTMEHIQANVWPDFLEKRLQRSPPFEDFVVEETTSADFKSILDPSIVREEYRSNIVRCVSLNGRYYAISEMPLRDYRGNLNPSLQDAGKIVFWKDVSDTHNTFFNNVINNLIYAAIGFVLIEILLYFGLSKTTTKLNTIIDKQTAQLKTEIALKDAKELKLRKFSLAVEQNPSVILITDKFGIIEYVNLKFFELTGYSRDEVIGQSPQILSSGQTSQSTYQALWRTLLAGKEWRGEFHNRKKNGDYYWANEYIAPIFDDAGNITHFVGLQDDITEHRKITQEINYQVSHDLLTGLINRREFEKRLLRLIKDTQQHKNIEHIFCFFDLDKFKIVNDTSGHPAGDELLRQISTLTKENIRQRDTLARFGGDEFGILMESCSLQKAEYITEKIRDLIEHFVFIWEDKSFSVGVSIGIVSISDKTKDMTEAFKQADAACYAAKEAGRNRVCIYHEDDINLSSRKNELEWANETLESIQDNRMVLFVQVITPISNRTSNKLRYEILVRQFTADGNQIFPSQFLPALERYNLAVKLDQWVINATFSFLQNHAEQINDIEYFSINLSGQSLCSKKIHDLIVWFFDLQLIPSSKIVFEITETVAISNITDATNFISSLKQYGCRFALDDFGSGMSSFAYLKKLPVDYLKIDGLFVKDIVEDPIDYAMVKSINEVGQLMGLETIAEFVENDDILQKLTNINVDCAQGYGLGRPQALKDLFKA